MQQGTSNINTEVSPTNSLLAHACVADSYGYCFEDRSSSSVRRHNNLNPPNGSDSLLRYGRYSDDTQMLLAITEVVASESAWTPLAISQSFVDCFQRDPRRGYAERFFQFLSNVRSGQEFLEKINPISEKNGAAVRSLILGLYEDPSVVIQRAEIQAKITHDTRRGVDAAIATAMIIHFFAFNLGSAKELADFLDKYLPEYSWNNSWHGRVTSDGIDTVRAAVTAMQSNDSHSSLLKACVAYCGDVDSVATIALAGASITNQYIHDIPAALWQQLREPNYGVLYLEEVERKARLVIQSLNK